jgi:hypothetical protein
MSKISWALLALGAVLLITGKVLLLSEAATIQQSIHRTNESRDARQVLRDLDSMIHAEMVGYGFIVTSLIPFGIAAWRIYYETQTPTPGNRPPRQGGGGGF